MTVDPTSINRRLETTGLPILPVLPLVVQALSSRGLAVLVAEPGAGKSTLVPLALLAGKGLGPGRILLLEPRRLAAVATASRIAELLGEEVGQTVGYSVRLERKVSRETRIEVVTEGLLTRRLESDPALTGVSAIIFDEFHERSIHSDLALALCLDLRRLRGDLALLLMSATMDGTRVSSFLSSAEGGEAVPLIDAPGRQYPVSISYAPSRERERPGDAAARVIADEILSNRADGDILAFFPGKREIEDAAGALSRLLPPLRAEIFRLHGSLPLAAQRDLFRPAPESSSRPPRIVLSTNLAETSLTVPGVTLVVDTGLVRLSRYHLSSAMDRLSLEEASEASTAQRAGRAGRLAPGRCIRLWREGSVRPRVTEPEILRTELSSLVLDSALWGARTASDLQWLDPPPAPAWKAAQELLIELGALDRLGAPTERGKLMAPLGLSPRLSSLVLEARHGGSRSSRGSRGMLLLAACSAALLSDRDGSGIRGDADFSRRLALLRDPRSEGSGGLTAPWRERTLRLASDILSRLGAEGEARELSRLSASWTLEEEASVGLLLAFSFPDCVARRQSSSVYRMVSGREVRLEGPLSSLEWIVVLEADAGERTGTVYQAASLSLEGALAVLEPIAQEERTVEWKGLAARTVTRRKAGRLLLRENRVKSLPEELPAAFALLLAEKGLSLLPWGEGAAHSFLERARFFESRGAEKSPDGGDSLFSDAALVRDASEVFGPYLSSDGGPVLSPGSLLDALRGRLDYRSLQELESRVPERFTTPARTVHPFLYEGGKVRLEVRIQEIFGLSASPMVLGERVVLTLMSPAHRPLQVTEDLESFWRTTWPEVRKEMRGRYPRHYWPENPLEAEPTARVKPRGT